MLHIFDAVKTDKYVADNGLYNKLIMKCSFKDRMSKISKTETEGCRGFRPTITSNGMCYTFNGKKTSELWKPSGMITTFANLFPSNSITLPLVSALVPQPFGSAGREKPPLRCLQEPHQQQARRLPHHLCH